jgi:hypothetical protein
MRDPLRCRLPDGPGLLPFTRNELVTLRGQPLRLSERDFHADWHWNGDQH